MKKTFIITAYAFLALIVLSFYYTSRVENRLFDSPAFQTDSCTTPNIAFYNLDRVKQEYDYLNDAKQRLNGLEGKYTAQEIKEEQIVMNRRVNDAISVGLQRINENQHYTLILATSEAEQEGLLSLPVSLGDSSIDITQELLNLMNVDYLAKKNVMR